MINRQKLREQLTKHEGFRPVVYDDATGKPVAVGSMIRGKLTIGVGRNLEDKGLSEDEINYLLDNDITDCIMSAQRFRWYDKLDPVRQAAVVELIFNLGVSKFCTFKKFIIALSEHRWVHAAAELKDSLWFRQVGPHRGLAIVNQVLKGEWK